MTFVAPLGLNLNAAKQSAESQELSNEKRRSVTVFATGSLREN